MKALIHIGIPKSGTSSIQAFLAMNRARLARQGVLYAPYMPDFGSQFELPVTALHACGQTIAPELERRMLGLHSLSDQACYVAGFTRFLDKALAQSTAPSFIGSSEHLHAWLREPRQVAALDSFLRARFSDITYLVYLRRPEELVISRYSEAIRRGATQDFQTYLAQHRVVDHWAALKPWRRVVGRDRVQVRLLCVRALQGGDLLTDFASVAGLSLDGLQRPAPVNTALTASEIALRRQLNRLLPVLGRDGRPHWAYRAARQVLRPILARDPARLQLSMARTEDIRAWNAETTARLRKKLPPEIARWL